MRRLRSLAVVLGLAGGLAAQTSGADVATTDPARRGLDVFLHVPDTAAPRSTVPVQIEAFAFPTVVALVPLAGAAIEAAWDPESLGPGLSEAPPPVRATTDASGRVHLDVPVPDGDVRDLVLLIGLRFNGHERTRKVTVHRGPAEEIQLHVADTRVVPGSSVSAWVRVTRAATGEPAASEPVELRLIEGGYPRFTTRLVTDLGGTAMARVPIPRNDEPSWQWQLTARTLSPSGRDSTAASETLTPREETPGTPKMFVSFDDASVLAGDKLPFTFRVRDATDQPIAGLPVRYWIGPKGTEPPKDPKDWDRISTFVRTSPMGEIHGETTAPSTVVKGVGTTMRLVAKTTIEGHELTETSTASVGVGVAEATLSPETGTVIPGIEQRMLLRVLDGRFNPVAAPFAVEGDGLKATVTTDKDGEAEVTWHPPVDVGALRNVGPCAGGVAAAVRVRPLADVPALHPRTEAFELCVPIDRDASAMIALDRPIARMGEPLHFKVLETDARKKAAGTAAGKAADGPKTAWSVVMRSENGEQTASTWLEDGEKGGDLMIPDAAAGAWSLSAVSPGTARASRVVGTSILVTPKVLPKLVATIGGGRAAPGGAVDVDADLTDGHGHGLPGTVAAVVVDLHGGGSVSGLEALDLRRSLCNRLGIEDERCDRFVEGDPALDALRRGRLGNEGKQALAPENDPAANAREALLKSFGDVLHSLEGAVFEATRSAESLRDVRRKATGNGWTFNPELMTLVTAAMDKPPETPGGEPLGLGDLLAVDPQVTFDNVARRITRLKLFRVLAEVRAFRKERSLDADEPIFKNPNALLRRLVREGRLGEDLLLDPWGGTIQFTASPGPPIPFLSVVRGFELHAPGPDGKVGTGDDVRDPFERVLRSGTPYASAVSEDRIVDAKFDLEVGDATVSAWQSLFEELTGSALGGGLGLSGVGEGGGGHGEGIGLGSIGTIGHGSGRGSSGIATGVAFWSAPKRTDAQGHLRIHVPLGDAETTWRVALVGVPDQSRPATATVDIPVALPLSARVDAGATWVEGDVVRTSITLRNRTDHPIHAAIDAVPGGVAQLVGPREGQLAVDVPAGSATVATVGVRAPSPGQASLTVTVRAPGLPDDVLRHTWDVREAGEPTDLTRSMLVEEHGELSVVLDPTAMRLRGEPRLVLERGFDESLRAALESLDPDGLRTPETLADALEVGARLERWAVAREGEGSSVARRAAEIRRRALGRLAIFSKERQPSWPVGLRVAGWSPVAEHPAPGGDKGPTCPGDNLGMNEAIEGLDVEPAPVSGASLACWDAFVSDTVRRVSSFGNDAEVARALLALADRPHRAEAAASLADRLRAHVELRLSGGLSLPSNLASDRASRATIYAGLLRAVRLGKPHKTTAERLAAWIAVQRDVDGGYGSPQATRAVVRALLASGIEVKGTTTATITPLGGGAPRTVELSSSSRAAVPLDARVTGVQIDVQGPAVIARFERPTLRFWSKPPGEIQSPIRLDVVWPTDARAGKTGILRVHVRRLGGGSAPVDLRLPLPPAVALAAPLPGVQQIQGVLAVRRALDGFDQPTLIEIPVRFGLVEAVTVPEARARIVLEDTPRAVVPAQPLVVR